MKIMYVFAGNNGSGKSTYRDSIKSTISTEVDIDTDYFEKLLKNEGVENYKKESGKLALALIDECIEDGVSFSMETTLSSNLSVRQIKQAKQAGFKIVMYYLKLTDVDLNILRVKTRHAQGGHDIPTEDILRRHQRSLDNLKLVEKYLDELHIVDNSKNKTKFN